jgi:hypothetical protein
LTARETGPSYRKGARAASISRGGQSPQRSTGSSVGRPHRAHRGGTATPTSPAHRKQIGQVPVPHAAHCAGNNSSPSALTIAHGRPSRRHVPVPTGDACSAGPDAREGPASRFGPRRPGRGART